MPAPSVITIGLQLPLVHLAFHQGRTCGIVIVLNGIGGDVIPVPELVVVHIMNLYLVIVCMATASQLNTGVAVFTTVLWPVINC